MVMVVASLNQLYQTSTLFCLVSLVDFLVFILNLATLIAVLRHIHLACVLHIKRAPSMFQTHVSTNKKSSLLRWASLCYLAKVSVI